MLTGNLNNNTCTIHGVQVLFYFLANRHIHEINWFLSEYMRLYKSIHWIYLVACCKQMRLIMSIHRKNCTCTCITVNQAYMYMELICTLNKLRGGGYGKYENTCSSIHRLENLIILFTKRYVFQTKMRSSRPNAMVLKNVLTKRLYIEQFLLLKKITTIIGQFCF